MKGTKKANNRHEYGKGNGKFGKKADRKLAARERTPRTQEERLAKAGAKEITRYLKVN